jgi:hypothetical protein
VATGQPFTIHVVGYKEAALALNAVNRNSKRVLYAGLRDAARPISDDTRSRLAKYNGISLGTINPSATTRGVSIRQRAKKVTGLRPDFGALQMSQGLIPAAEAGTPGIIPRVEAAYAALITEEGL